MDTNKNEAKVAIITFTVTFKYVHENKLCITFIILGH